jgi:hypothetical protein
MFTIPNAINGSGIRRTTVGTDGHAEAFRGRAGGFADMELVLHHMSGDTS